MSSTSAYFNTTHYGLWQAVRGAQVKQLKLRSALYQAMGHVGGHAMPAVEAQGSQEQTRGFKQRRGDVTI